MSPVVWQCATNPSTGSRYPPAMNRPTKVSRRSGPEPVPRWLSINRIIGTPALSTW